MTEQAIENTDNFQNFRDVARVVLQWKVELRPHSSSSFQARVNRAITQLKRVEAMLSSVAGEQAACDASVLNRELITAQRTMRTTLVQVSGSDREFRHLPRVVAEGKEDQPRILKFMSSYLEAVGQLSADSLLAFLRVAQEYEILTVAEMWSLPQLLQFALTEAILSIAEQHLEGVGDARDTRLLGLVEDLRRTVHLDWTALLEPQIVIDTILRSDPAECYGGMDFDSREGYRRRIAFIARYSDCSEQEVAAQVLDLAKSASVVHCSERQRRRRIHVGYYLFEEGFKNLRARVGYHPPLAWRFRELIKASPNDFYITGIQLTTLVLVSVVLFPLIGEARSFLGMLLALVLLIMPAMQSAVDVLNHCVSALFEPEIIPKLDFGNGIPADCTTLVAIPTLLLHDKQVRQLFKDLEVRYLGNRDANLHFAILSDLPDSVSKPVESDHRLVHLAIQLTDQLNAKYCSPEAGRFFLLHRRSTFNVRQGVWMGWERKRGKLLELNKFLLGEADAFAVKAGPLERIAQVRYVLTLDSDTCLPRESAAKLVGAIAHPLNQAVVDPHRRIVTQGYGILQPRIGVSVRSNERSRLAAIYSGQTGMDIYSRAASDAYQDLYREGIYTGKGIYEIETLHQVLDGRFPKNSLLSHDLIEGAYARAGLLTDVELIDDYPSHLSAYMRRKHRWVRGDWQIVQWMLAKVPSESGARVASPISAISRWKIFDNLRRSLLEPFVLMLFLAGWFVLPGGAVHWTIVSLALLLFPTAVQFLFGVGRTIRQSRPGDVGETLTNLGRALAASLLNLCFLPHHSLLAADAIARALIRQFITGKRLLEWETAAQAEATRSGVVDRFLFAIPVLACGLGAVVYRQMEGRSATALILSVLSLWFLATVLAAWLNQPPRMRRRSLGQNARSLLHHHALRIWRYFAEYGGPSHNYLIPDNVEEEERHEAARVSPTNIGLLLNARQAACELGFLSVPEFAELTDASLNTIVRLEKYRGHLYNWYDTRTCEALEREPFVSSVDSGNLVASLYMLEAGARQLLRKPLLDRALFEGVKVHLKHLQSEHRLPASVFNSRVPDVEAPVSEWLKWSMEAGQELPAKQSEPGRPTKEWWRAETGRRLEAIVRLVKDYLPWLQPEFAPLLSFLDVGQMDAIESLSLEEAIDFAERAHQRMATTLGPASEQDCLASRMYKALTAAKQNLSRLQEMVMRVAETAERIADATEFTFLVHPERRVLSIGFDVRRESLHSACYDMLASEARIATFIAIARNELPQRAWFRLGREYTKAYGHYVLQSWTGTSFEYLMPTLWMRFHPHTVLGDAVEACVRVQQAFARKLRIPWGISECGMAKRDDGGHYQYRAFGVPEIAVSAEAKAGPVVSPYSSYLALCVDPAGAVRNLKRMASAGWMGDYGLYEAGDYSVSRRNCEIVREWMAHHQGMSLLAILNSLKQNLAQQWFHAHPDIESAELLLTEVAPTRARLKMMTELGTMRRRVWQVGLPKAGYQAMHTATK